MQRPSVKPPLVRIASLLLAALALTGSGCLLIAAGAAGGAAAVTYVYCKGKVCGAYNAGFDDTWAAVHTALGELGMAIRTEDPQSGTITTHTADGQRVHIQVDLLASRIPAEPVLTRVCIRVAAFGDRSVSERILDQIGYHLAPAQLATQVAAGAQSAGPGVMQAGASTPALPPAPPVSAPGVQTAPPPVLPTQPEPVRQ